MGLKRVRRNASHAGNAAVVIIHASSVERNALDRRSLAVFDIAIQFDLSKNTRTSSAFDRHIIMIFEELIDSTEGSSRSNIISSSNSIIRRFLVWHCASSRSAQVLVARSAELQSRIDIVLFHHFGDMVSTAALSSAALRVVVTEQSGMLLCILREDAGAPNLAGERTGSPSGVAFFFPSLRMFVEDT